MTGSDGAAATFYPLKHADSNAGTHSMRELIDTHPSVAVSESEYLRLLGYPPGHALEGRARDLAEWAGQWYREQGRPWVYVRRVDVLELTDAGLNINGASFVSKSLHDQFSAAQADGAVLVAVSAGRQCEEKARELWQEGKPDEYFFLEMFGSAVVEYLITSTGGRICDWAEQNGMAVLPHYSPGYSGWDVSDQTKLWALIQSESGFPFQDKLQVMSTGMLQPKKSLLALFGITRHPEKLQSVRHLVPCHNCSLPRCAYRRAPFRRALPQIEDVRQLQSRGLETSLPEINGVPRLRQNAKYSLNPRALRKWAEERLRLAYLQDGSVAATFRYEGTTCTNLGQPLEFDYHVRVGPARDGHRILESGCVPAPGDIGHTCQCEYLNNADALMGAIAAEKPLLGRPLDDVLTWPRPYSPSGCYCDAERRAHKWGLVLEVVHFALAKRERNGETL